MCSSSFENYVKLREEKFLLRIRINIKIKSYLYILTFAAREERGSSNSAQTLGRNCLHLSRLFLVKTVSDPNKLAMVARFFAPLALLVQPPDAFLALSRWNVLSVSSVFICRLYKTQQHGSISRSFIPQYDNSSWNSAEQTSAGQWSLPMR